MEKDQIESTAKKLHIRNLFNTDERYIVPIYQRNYAWGREEIEQLLTDIIEAARDPKINSYFLGNLIVAERNYSSEGIRRFEVIDGQQRLTTLYLVTMFLRAKGSSGLYGEVDSHPLQYESRPKSTYSLETLSLPNSFERTSAHIEDSGMAEALKIIQAFTYMTDEGRAENPLLKDQQVADFFLDNVVIVRASIPSGTDLNRYFEVMNTRGQQLSPVDIVKARLMGNLSSRQEQDIFARVWDACSNNEQYIQVSLSRGNTHLRTQLFGANWDWLQPKDSTQLLELMGKSETPDEESSISFASPAPSPMSLHQAISHYAQMPEDKGEISDESLRFSSIVAFPNLLLHALSIHHGVAGQSGTLDDKQFISKFEDLLTSKDEAEKNVQDFLYTLLKTKFLFDNFILKREYTSLTGDKGDWSLLRLVKSKKQSQKKESSFYYKATFKTQNDDYSSLNTQVRLLQSMLRVTYTSPRTMYWVSLAIESLWNIDSAEDISGLEMLQQLESYTQNRVREEFNNDGTLRNSGFNIERIIFTYLDYLLVKGSELEKTYRFTFRNSIEHFAPQTVDTAERTEETKKYWENRREHHINELGNLALLSVNDNSKYSNYPPTTKAREEYQHIHNRSPKLNLMAEITRQNNEWGPKQIQTHGEEMLKLLLSKIEPSSGNRPTNS